MAVKYLDDKNVDGTVLGQASTTKVGLWGVTPVVQPSSASQAAVTATALGTIDFTSATEAATVVAQVNSLTTLVNKLRADLVTVGAIKGSA